MLKYLTRDRLQIFWLVFHAVLGFVATLNIFPLVVWYYLIFLSGAVHIYQTRNRQGGIHYILAYFLGFEMLARMVRASPFIPHESGKYFTLILLLMGIFFHTPRHRQAYIGWFIILLSLPSLMVMYTDRLVSDLVFDYLGIFNLGLALVYFSTQAISIEAFRRLLRLMVYSMVALLVAVLIDTPDLSSVEFGFAAFGRSANQVATILGLAFTIFGLMFITNQQLFKYKILDMGLMGLFFFRALLTFSRGGVMVGALGLIAALIFPKKRTYSHMQFRKVKFSNMVLIVLALGTTFYFTNDLTGNVLLLRFQGETQGTLAGYRARSLDSVTTGRWELMKEEYNTWLENPIFGLGPGGTSRAREIQSGQRVSVHTEATRLLAEHGIFGLFIALIFLLYPIVLIFRERDNYQRAVMLCFFSLAVLTSFHSAMRTMITPFLYGLATLRIVPVAYLRDRAQRGVQTLRPPTHDPMLPAASARHVRRPSRK